METLLRRSSALLAALACCLIVYATMSPVEAPPHMASQGLEHVLAFAVLGSLLQLAKPGRPWRILFFLVLAAGSLELAQHLRPDRHGTLLDFGRKAAGAGLGIAIGEAANRLLWRLSILR